MTTEVAELNDSLNKSMDNAVQTKLVIREGQLRVEQVSVSEIKVEGITPEEAVKLNTSAISGGSDLAVDMKPELVTLMGGMEECSSWLIAYVASANQYCRNENDVSNKVKRDFSVFLEKEDLVRELRGLAQKIPLLDFGEEGQDRMYRTNNSIRYMIDSCITLHFFMKGTNNVERIIKDNHKDWYDDASWEKLGLPYECLQKILKGKVYKAMNGAIAGKYSNWPGVKEFAQRHTYGSKDQQMKFSDLYRMVKKDFAAPHDIIKHMQMEVALEHCVRAIPGLNVTGIHDERKMVAGADVLDLVNRVKHLQQSGVRNIHKDFASFHPDCKDWTSYHMSYQKMNQHFRNLLSPGGRRRSSRGAQQQEERSEICSAVVDSTCRIRHQYRAIGVNTVVEKKRSRNEEVDTRHVSYNERDNSAGRSRSNSAVAEKDDNTTVFLNTDKRSVVSVVGLPGTGKTTTLATLLGRVHNKHTPSTVLVLSDSCTTTQRLLEFTSGTFIRGCPFYNKTKGVDTNTFVVPGKVSEEVQGSFSEDEDTQGDDTDSSLEKVEKPASEEGVKIEIPRVDTPELIVGDEEAKAQSGKEVGDLEEGEIREESETKDPATANESSKPVEKPSCCAGKSEQKSKPSARKEAKVGEEFNKTEIPWMVYNDISEILNSSSDGRITVLHFPNYEDMDPEIVCGALERFVALPSSLPKYLVVDNTEVLTNTCNNSTLDKLIEQHRHNNMSVWVASTSPGNLPLNSMDYAHLTILHQFSSKSWYSELAEHLPITSATFNMIQGLGTGQCVMVAPGAAMQHPQHSSSCCYPANIVTPKPIK